MGKNGPIATIALRISASNGRQQQGFSFEGVADAINFEELLPLCESGFSLWGGGGGDGAYRY